MSSGCWLHVSGLLLVDLSVFVYAVLHVAAHPGSNGDLPEKQSLRSGGSRLLGGGLVPGSTRAAHCEAGDAPADSPESRTRLTGSGFPTSAGKSHRNVFQDPPGLRLHCTHAKALAQRTASPVMPGRRSGGGGERAAPYNFCGPYRFAPRTPSCTNR
ncbi:unnamed protein product [Pleuronectes platessa]|uniref:Secreted protein n=1 Tax=Pleuronectes platessa TaxID=8262 RepID=A0A9N7VND3_PLEPL|nr:unnamed protein product [Pleuronectes platessa]